MIFASLKSAIRSLLGPRVSFLTGFLLRGTWRFVASGFRLRQAHGAAHPGGVDLRDETPIFNHLYLLFLLHLLRIRKIRKITVSWSCLQQGAGYQVVMRMRALALASTLGISYVHTPMQDIHQAEGDMQDYCAIWERMFNLGEGHEVCEEIDLGLLDFGWAPNSAVLHLFGRKESHSDLEATIPDLRRRYYLTNPPAVRTAKRITICVHVRRGWDVGPFREDMWTEDEKIARTIDWLQKAMEHSAFDFEIQMVSRGDELEFRQAFGDGITFCLDEPSDVAVRRMIDADVLVLARSRFSYVAGVISQGVKIYETWEHPPLAGWLTMDDTGRFDREAFGQALSNLPG